MDKIKKSLGYINIIVMALILIAFNKELLIPKDGTTSILEEKRSAAEKRTIMVEWKTATWSGIIFESTSGVTKILTIIHEDSMKKIKDSGNLTVKISSDDGRSYSGEIKKWNNLRSAKLKRGQRLKVSPPYSSQVNQTTVSASGEGKPSEAASQSSEQTAEVKPAPAKTSQQTEVKEKRVSGVKTYKIKPGDSLWKVAVSHGMTLSEIQKLNGFSSRTVLKAGMKIKVKSK
jgi:LysM repeat protein